MDDADRRLRARGHRARDGKPLFAVHRAGPADVESALASAAAAFPGWAAAMADVRERVLLRAADVMESRAEEFLELLVREGGKAQPSRAANLPAA